MKKKIHFRQGALRKWVQALSALAVNAHLKGFFTGKIYTGPLKHFCVPGLNCYSCPGAVGACPIGAIQAVVGSRKGFPFLVVGWLALIGVLLGRFVCGWLYLRLSGHKWRIYPALISAMVLGRVVWGIVRLILAGLSAQSFTMAAFISGALLTAIPGILLQLVLVPLLVTALERAKVMPHERRAV